MKAIGILQRLQLLQVQSLQTINYGRYCSKGDLGTGQSRNKTQHEAIKIHNLSYDITIRKCYCQLSFIRNKRQPTFDWQDCKCSLQYHKAYFPRYSQRKRKLEIKRKCETMACNKHVTPSLRISNQTNLMQAVIVVEETKTLQYLQYKDQQ